MKLDTAIRYMNANASSPDPGFLGRDVTSFAIDSRDVQPGDVFFALSQPDYQNNCFNGEFADSTVYVPAAFEKGAAACVLRPDRFEEWKEQLEPFRDRLIFADDVIAAFQKLAHGIYLEWDRPVVAITGSAGKTTAKELTAHVLGSSGRKILKNIKNYNNGLGHPLTVLKLAADMSYDAAVLEMGMSTPMNEIQRLCRITPPDVAVELNVLPVHIEHLGSIENIAKAKAELVENMKDGGTAVLNADDPFVFGMREKSRGSTITYGIDSPADVRAENIRFKNFGNTVFDLVINGGRAETEFPLNGRHSIMNGLAAAAVGTTFGMTPSDIAKSLSLVVPPTQRGEVLRFKEGFTVINDSYNSNPAALKAMVQTLIDGNGSGGRKIVVAGEMLELGPESARIHAETGTAVAGMGVDLLIGVRGFAADLVDGAKNAGLIETAFAADSDEAGEMLASMVRSGDVVLIKGSRGVRTEKVLERLQEKFEVNKQ